MPVHHEKVDKAGTSRGSSRNRNVQREESLDRRPVITQEKPIASKSKPTKQKERTKVPSTSKDAIVGKPVMSRTVPTTRSSAAVKEKASASKEVEKTAPSKKAITEKKAQTKVSPRISRAENPRTKPTVENLLSKPKITNTTPITKKNDELLRNKMTKAVKKTAAPEAKQERGGGHERTKTRTLSPSEVKILANSNERKNDLKSKNESKKKEEVLVVEQNKNEEQEEEEDNYEDDFEDYESDFEEDSEESQSNGELEEDEKSENNLSLVPSNNMNELTQESEIISSDGPNDRLSASKSARRRVSTQESQKDFEAERKLDSGSYHFAMSHQKRELDDVKNAMRQENLEKKFTRTGDTDEGFLDEVEKPLIRDLSNELLDFAGAGRREKKRESIQKQRRRGDILSQMITLDAVTYTLMEITPVPYDAFMKTHGRSDTSQVHSQTNEEDCEEETQTEDISVTTKWTQAPTEFTPIISDDGTTTYAFSKQERLGVGGDENAVNADGVVFATPSSTVNTTQLNRFLSLAGQRVRIWLEAQSQHQISLAAQQQQSSEITCCDGKVPFQVKRKEDIGAAVIVEVAPGNNNLVIAVHKNKRNGSFIFVWNILEPSSPLKILACHREIQCAGFSPGRGSLIFGGATDGSLNVWDLREGAELHHEKEGVHGRSPTYSTAEVEKDGHVAAVVSVQVLSKDMDDATVDFTPLQFCSMDESGMVITWSVVQQSGVLLKVPNADLGLAPWGRVRLVKTSMFRVADILPKEDVSSHGRFSVLQVLKPENNEILIGSTSGEVIHCSTKGILLKPKSYAPNKNSRPAAVLSLAVFPLDPRYFLVGCSDGTIRFHKCEQEQPLINLHWNLGDTTPASSVKTLQWLHSKPCMFFCLDATTRLHIWNLGVSDIYPQITLAAFVNPVTCFKLIRPKRLSQHGYLVIGRGDGNVELHRRKEEFRCKSKDEFKKERKMFQRYVTIL